MGLIDKIKAKMEIRRLEQRYTRREKRSTFISGAQYVDGEYVYNHSTGGSSNSSSSFGSSNSYVPANGHGSANTAYIPANGTPFAANGTTKSNKRMSRLFA